MPFVPDVPITSRFVPDESPSKAIGDILPNVGVGEAVLSGLTGMAAAPLSGLAGGAAALIPGLRPGIGADVVRGVGNALTYQPRSELGRNIIGGASVPGEWYAGKADRAGAATAEATGSPLLGAAVNTGIQALPLLVGGAASKIANRPAALAANAERQSLNVPRDAAIAKAQDSGISISPAEANPSILNRVFEGFAGQSKTQLLTSTKNVPVFNAIVRKAFGIDSTTPLSVDAMESVRKVAGAEYEKVRGAGRVATDEPYSKRLDAIESKYVGAEADFPAMAKSDVRDAVKAARVDSFDANSGVDAIKIQRSQADKAFRQGDTELGKAHKAIADAIEQQIDTHLQQFGPTRQLADFRNARETIAKSYDVQKALKGNDVDVRVLAQQMKKGRPLSGDIKDLADFGNRFPASAQAGGKNAYVPSAFDFGLGGAGGLASHMALGAASPLAAAVGVGVAAARPVTRGMLASRPYQSVMAQPQSYGTGIPGLGNEIGLSILAAEQLRKRGLLPQPVTAEEQPSISQSFMNGVRG